MRAANMMVFDEVIQSGSSPARSAEAQAARLAGFDQLAIMAVVDNVVGGSTGFKVSIEHSADGRTWLPKSGGTLASPASAEIGGGGANNPAVTLAGVTQSAYFGYSDGSAPMLGYVRFSVHLGATASAHVRLFVTGRNRSAR